MAHPSFFAASLYVALGGGAGAWLRFVVGRMTLAWLGPVRAGAFPWATMTVNVAGSLAMGVLVGWMARHAEASPIGAEATRLLVGIGLLGGFTTFSSFSLDIVTLAGRGQFALAGTYASLSLAAGVGGLLAGLALMRSTA